MNVYYAESIQVHNGSDRLMGHTYDAVDTKEAQAIAKHNGWEYVGEAVYEEECPDDVIAVVELHLTKPSIH